MACGPYTYVCTFRISYQTFQVSSFPIQSEKTVQLNSNSDITEASQFKDSKNSTLEEVPSIMDEIGVRKAFLENVASDSADVRRLPELPKFLGGKDLQMMDIDSMDVGSGLDNQAEIGADLDVPSEFLDISAPIIQAESNDVQSESHDFQIAPTVLKMMTDTPKEHV
ncbi:unnamed protein product [Caenorhabditis auriculariae]|uniref:Uncharacterized protein n=1 Tax=Caenorhabditis auriculariae TaxID=2777116 RepID=A0A8S1HV19_9PELO|nr:unnamed protein product [Caenorhabditis auriculariae]